MRRTTLLLAGALITHACSPRPAHSADNARPTEWVQQAARRVEPQVIAWRRHIHQHPELGNQEVQTAAYVAQHLRKLGLEVTTDVAKTGVVAVLRGGRRGKVVALRADMDALAVKETSGLPFASQARGTFFGTEVDVAHMCGHDAHTAMLMGAAQVLAENRDKLPGQVVFIFQPAEEGAADIDVFAPNPPSWGAKRVLEEGILKKYGVQAIFGVHVMANARTGELLYKKGAALNSADSFRIVLTGIQAHASMPWTGADPVVAGAQVINVIQTLVSRRIDVTRGMGVVTVGSVHAGTAGNIIPGQLTMEGTIRTNEPSIRETLRQALPDAVTKVAQANRVQAEVQLAELMPVTLNDVALTTAMVPALERAAPGRTRETFTNQAASEDFSYYAQQVPGLFVFLGGTPPDRDPMTAPSNHNPNFFIDEATLVTGVRAHVEFVLAYAELARTP